MTVGAIEAICRAAGADADGRQIEALDRFIGLLQRWNKTYNLTAVRDPAAMLVQHLADCVAIVPAVRRRCPAGRILDVGSGGGLPGAVLSILLPVVDVTCVDAVAKKAAFVRQVAGQVDLPNLHAIHSRVEDLVGEQFELITSRAFASLRDFVAGTEHLLATAGVWTAMKGRRPDEEIAALPPAIDVFHVEHIVVPHLDAERCLVWMRRRDGAA